MLERILEFVESAGLAITYFALAVIVIGFVVSTGRYVLGIRELTAEQNFLRLKIELARILTLGLEILVVAVVVKTITVTPSYRSLVVLAFLVAIRTVTSWTLSLQIEGRWPWQEPIEADRNA